MSTSTTKICQMKHTLAKKKLNGFGEYPLTATGFHHRVILELNKDFPVQV